MTRWRAFDLSLYLITDRALCRPREVTDVVRRAIAGGATLVQLRDPQAKTADLIDQARELVALLRPAGVPLIINDRVDVALAADADGVHVGQSDMHPADVRRLIGPERIVGLSITRPSELARAEGGTVDYLGVGPLFSTQTKPDAGSPIGPAGLRAIARLSALPIVAIGGIDRSNAAAVIEAGARGLAVVSAICCAGDPELAARELRAAGWPSNAEPQ